MSNKFLEAVDGYDGPPSLVKPRKDPLIFGILVSVLLHVGVGFAAVCAGWLIALIAPERDLIEPDEAMEVSMMMLKQGDRLPDKAMHAPRKAAPAPDVQTPTMPTPEAAPPDPGSSDMTFEDPTKKKAAEKKSQEDRDALAKKREEALRKMMMDDALADLDTPTGPRDREATDPTSTSPEKIDLGGQGVAADPEVVKYLDSVRKLFRANFRPLRTITDANPGLKTTVKVMIDVDTGEVLSVVITKPSGNDSYDAAVNSACAAVASVPVPPPQARATAEGGFTIDFKPPS